MDPAFSHYIKMAKWCGKNLPPSSKIVTRKAEFFYWYSKLRGVCVLYNKDPMENLVYFNDLNIDYMTLTYTGFDGISRPYFYSVLNTYPQFFEVVKAEYVPGMGNKMPHYILKIKKEKLKKFLKKNYKIEQKQ